MKTLLELRGIVTVLNTPFTEDDRIDTEGLRANVRYAIDAGVAGFLVPAMASEVGRLSERERIDIVAAVLDEARGRATVIGGASASTADARRSAAAQLVGLGCPGILVSIPYTDDEQYESEVRALAELHPGFLMLQDWDATGPGLPISLIKRLFNILPELRCLKIETANAGPKYSQLLQETGGQLHISGGWAVTQMIEGLNRGVHAFMPTGLHRAYCAVYRLHAAGQYSEAVRLFHRLTPILSFSNQHLDLSIRFFKRLLHRQGVYRTDRVREPLTAWDSYQQSYAEELIAYAIRLEDELLETRRTDS